MASNSMLGAQSASAAAPNVRFSSAFASLDGWILKGGAAEDAAVSSSAGSGSIRLPSAGSALWSPTVAVRAGVLYEVRMKVRQDSWPRGTVSIAIQHTGPEGQWIRSLSSGTATAPWRSGEFADSGLFFGVRSDVSHIQVVLIRSLEQASSDPMWVDDLQLVESPSIDRSRSPKTAFDGTQTRIDEFGNWQVRNGSAWIDWFPLCAAINPARSGPERLAVIARQGFKCNIWNGADEASLQRHKAAGLRSFFQLAQYTNPKGWATGDLNDLQQKLATATSSSAADFLAGFFLDNENQHASVVVTRQVTDLVKQLDVDAATSKRRRPIVQLQGNYGSLGLWSDEAGRPFTDAVGAYAPIGEDGGAGSGPGGQVFLETQANQTQPSALCQINDGVGEKFRAALFACLAHGSRMASYWGDGPVDPRFPDVPDLENQAFWRDLPAISRDLGYLQKVIRANSATDWSAGTTTDNELLPVTMGRRTVDGLGHLIIANLSAEAQTRQIVVAGLPYKVGEVREFVTNQLLARVDDIGSFSVTLAGAAVGSGGLVVRLVPAGWKLPIANASSAPPAAKPSTKSSAKVTTKPRVSTTKPKPQPKPTAAPATTRTVAALTVPPRSPLALCAGGMRLEAEAATTKGSVPALQSGSLRAWARAGAPSALDWQIPFGGRLRFRVRYVRAGLGPAKRTLFLVTPTQKTTSKQFELASTGSSWGTAEVEVDAPGPGPHLLSASFDVLTDTDDLDAVDYVDVCPVA